MKRLALIAVLALVGLVGVEPSKSEAQVYGSYYGNPYVYGSPYRTYRYGYPYQAAYYNRYVAPNAIYGYGYGYNPVIAVYGYNPYWGLPYAYYPGFGYSIGGPTINSSSTVFTPGFIGTQTQFSSPVRR